MESVLRGCIIGRIIAAVANSEVGIIQQMNFQRTPALEGRLLLAVHWAALHIANQVLLLTNNATVFFEPFIHFPR